ncbi:DUF3995 domain-containing protein [Deinococcus radiotolerans]|uniref:DUF3995 domain-containing protein n=1 Tax=Deinococcus radiotolerans TaxID=1309407 RepID=A0ABQ2FM69_9DEIO|nr:DUF3995 domain-containing protein [Deinococcus radiotolerans]GGL08857.1 hypothetical protein GCM10010844_29510 [Deinococcus radiotolerans]
MTVCSVPAALILAALSALHVYWACGGTAGLHAALPQITPRAGSGPAFQPGPGLTLLVAVALGSGAALALLAPAGGTPRLLTLAVSAAFALRVLGDFRYVGLFKRVRGTTFAHWDDRLFIPLCLTLSLLLLGAARPA